MNADDLKKLTTESLNELAALLEQGHSERLTALLKTMARFHRYSLHNVCLIVAQRPSRHARGGFSRLAHCRPIRSQGREGHRDPRADSETSPRRDATRTSPDLSSDFVPHTCSTSNKPTARHCPRLARSRPAILATTRPH